MPETSISPAQQFTELAGHMLRERGYSTGGSSTKNGHAVMFTCDPAAPLAEDGTTVFAHVLASERELRLNSAPEQMALLAASRVKAAIAVVVRENAAHA